MPEAIGAIGGSLISGLFNSSAASKAAAAQKYAADLQQQRYNTTRNDLMPYNVTGQNAMKLYGDATGVNGQPAQQNYYSTFQNDPGFQTGVNYGLDQTSAQAAKTGHGGVSGNELQALNQYSQNAMYGQYHTRLDDLFRAGTTGENAAAQTGALGTQSAATQGNFIGTAGQYQGAATAQLGQGIASAGNNLANYYYRNPSVGSGSSYGPSAGTPNVSSANYDPSWAAAAV